MVRPDHWIRKMALEHGLIEPFSERVANDEIASYGLQPAGYDARLDPRILVFDSVIASGRVFDPLKPNRDFFFPKLADPYFDIPPHGFIEATTLEYFRVPRDCVVRGMGKNVYLGLGLIISSINPGWEGHLRIRIVNACSFPVRIYGNQGILHLQFEMLESACERSYSEIEGTRFQNQTILC